MSPDFRYQLSKDSERHSFATCPTSGFAEGRGRKELYALGASLNQSQAPRFADGHISSQNKQVLCPLPSKGATESCRTSTLTSREV